MDTKKRQSRGGAWAPRAPGRGRPPLATRNGARPAHQRPPDLGAPSRRPPDPSHGLRITAAVPPRTTTVRRLGIDRNLRRLDDAAKGPLAAPPQHRGPATGGDAARVRGAHASGTAGDGKATSAAAGRAGAPGRRALEARKKSRRQPDRLCCLRNPHLNRKRRLPGCRPFHAPEGLRSPCQSSKAEGRTAPKCPWHRGLKISTPRRWPAGVDVQAPEPWQFRESW